MTDQPPPARWWHTAPDGRVECDLCPRHCRLRDGQHGFCFVRSNQGGAMSLDTYGRSSGFAVDPVEKKPLNHVLPGARVFSFGTAGCNLACKFCQNWEISHARAFDRLTEAATPDQIADAAVASGCRAVAYTYHDPVVFAEYAIDVAAACRQRGLLNIAVTAGFIEPEPRAALLGAMDAANIDLKAFTPGFYRSIAGGRLETAQETLRWAVAAGVWTEVTTLLIPGLNDSEDELRQMAAWIAAELGPDVPWHVTAFHPAGRMLDRPPTSAKTVKRARAIGRAAGLDYVYTGNIADSEGATTWCPVCGAQLICRRGYTTTVTGLTPDGVCRACSERVPGIWPDQGAGSGARLFARGAGLRSASDSLPSRVIAG
jgi:pyruvate formate lyase activating enzyme